MLVQKIGGIKHIAKESGKGAIYRALTIYSQPYTNTA